MIRNAIGFMRGTVFILALAAWGLLASGCSIIGPSPEGRPYYALDGDTLAFGPDRDAPRVRLAYIDAPEMPGHCRSGRDCVTGDPFAAKRQLQALLDNAQSVTCYNEPARDPYKRRIADCFAVDASGGAPFSLSEAMLASSYVSLYEPPK